MLEAVKHTACKVLYESKQQISWFWIQGNNFAEINLQKKNV